ncbi:MAG: HNH endonuclease family protein [Alphaproteobacteria bacterium]|nr:HNH endonuclease family protein [Alphaproteobacteria bacterium]
MPNLLELVEFWQYLHTGGEFKAESIPVDFTEENWKQIQVLYSYANDYWKHPISLFYLKNKNNPNFNEEFLVFQKKFITFLLTRFINNPTVNAVKNDIFKLCVNIWKGEAVNFPQEDLENIKNRLNDFNKGKLTFALLLLNAYSNNNQAKLTDSLNIEHILPKKWEKANFTNWQKEDADKAMNMFGNKILLEESINKSLQYSSFNYKKDGYKNSKSLKAKELASKQGDWTMADVEKCNEDFINNILTFFEANR